MNYNPTQLDEYVARFQTMPPFNIHHIVDGGLDTQPWFEVRGIEIVAQLVINEVDLYNQVVQITAEIQKWGRLAAQTRRVWEIWERNYRAWRSRCYLDQIDPPDKPDDWKKPTEKAIEARYRINPVYHDFYRRIEAAEEANSATEAILNAFRAKKDMLLRFAYKSRDDSAPRLFV